MSCLFDWLLVDGGVDGAVMLGGTYGKSKNAGEGGKNVKKGWRRRSKAS